MLENTTAQDTLEGIVEWWLLERKIERNTAEVKSVLDELASKELIVEFTARDGRVRYRVNQSKKSEIAEFLNELEARRHTDDD